MMRKGIYKINNCTKSYQLGAQRIRSHNFNTIITCAPNYYNLSRDMDIASEDEFCVFNF